jgi:hypothetical protein
VTSDDSPITPRITGSLAIADGLRADLLAMADRLDRMDGAEPWQPGRPRLRVAAALRRVAKRVASWHDPHEPRTAPADREQDYQDAAQWLGEGRALLGMEER